jgi:hypothetical protein
MSLIASVRIRVSWVPPRDCEDFAGYHQKNSFKVLVLPNVDQTSMPQTAPTSGLKYCRALLYQSLQRTTSLSTKQKQSDSTAAMPFCLCRCAIAADGDDFDSFRIAFECFKNAGFGRLSSIYD